MKHKKLFFKVILFSSLILELIFAVLLYVYLNTKYNIGIPCAINQIFGIYCPGCGLTRAGISMLNLDFYQAFRYNAFSLILIPIVFFIFICIIWENVFDRSSIISRVPVAFWLILFSAFLLYGIIRNFVVGLQPVGL